MDNIMDETPVQFQEERKARIKDVEKLEKRIKKEGGTFRKEVVVEDTYFTQPPGEVLKISVIDGTPHLIRLQANEGKFAIVSDKTLDAPEQVRKDLTEHYGVHRTLKKRMRYWTYHDVTLNINIIDSVGTFLIVQGLNVDDTIFPELGITNPEFIEVSFDQL